MNRWYKWEMIRQLSRNRSGRTATAFLSIAVKVAVTIYLVVFFSWFCCFYSHQVGNALNHQEFVDAACDGSAPFVDSLKFYTVGQIARTHGNVYDENTQYETMRQLTGSNRSSPVGFAEYTPFFCVAAIPFTYLPIERACLVGSLLWLSLAVLAMTVLTRRRGFTWWQCGEFLVIILSPVTAFHNCQVGQISFLLLSLVAAYGMLLLEGNEYVAGVILGLLFIKPQYAIMLAAAPLAGRRWKTLISAAITLAVMVAISSAFLGWQLVAAYPSLLSHIDSTYAEHNAEMLGTRGFIANLITSGKTVSLISTIGYGIGFALCFILWKKPTTSKEKHIAGHSPPP
jgi:hypothetical protein